LELNWSTFILEILNFLVLVWLLKHFFYKPVQEVIARRKQTIEEQLQAAKNIQHEAELLRNKYENRLAGWQDERGKARKELEHEIDQQRQKMIADLQLELAAERKKNEILATRQATEQQRQREARALKLGARFASKVLRGLASPELQIKIIELLMTEMQDLPSVQKEALLTANGSSTGMSVKVLSAYPLERLQQQLLQQHLEGLLTLTNNLSYEYECDQELIAGVRITVGPWVIHANLYDELQIFSSIAYEK
jgi:F-type H+-transporting ATPase subunit b